ncbi:MAG TPA: phospholipase D-like domain-containing protein [Polyangiaceae bacterium]|nr:phospholipase D-like domain-containing protein [Polyangiaceae bacterium]
MSTNFIDVLLTWLGSGPSAPKYCQLVGPTATRSRQFGDELDGAASERFGLNCTPNAIVAAPTNALVWHIPDLGGTALTEDEKKEARRVWPPLRRLSGSPFSPADAFGDGTRAALLLEVFPAAFRRLEFLFSSLEVPTSMDDWDLPRMATPRWFWIRGFEEAALATSMSAIAAKHWPPAPAAAPTLTRFTKGLSPIYVDAGAELGRFASGGALEVSAFDATGLPIDPDFVFATFNRLASDSDFGRLAVAHPEPGYEPANRHVIVFCDQDGHFYEPRRASETPPTLPPDDPEAGDVEAAAHLQVLAPTAGGYDLAPLRVLVPEPGSSLAGASGKVRLAMTGTHVRLGTYPHGTLSETVTVDFAPQMFLRLQVLDYRSWFPRNANPRNRLARYTEGNLLTPLVDGADFLRELYRTLRATYKDIDTTEPATAFDPDAPVNDAAPAHAARAGIYLTNAWIEPHAPLLGRRGMVVAPKTQDFAPEDLPAFEVVMDKMKLVAARSVPGIADLPSSTPDQMQWWIVSEDGVLPPGAHVELRQLVFSDDYHGDDPRIPGDLLNADIFGIVAPFPGAAASSRAFVSTTGRFVLPVVYALGRDPMATLRITLWSPTSGEPKIKNYGEVMLPAPADFMSRPALDPGVTAQLRLSYEGVPGRVVVILEPGAITAAEGRAVVVLNPRSGELVVEDHGPNADAEIRIALTNFAMQDSALVGFLPPGSTDPTLCPQLFDLFLGRLPTDRTDPPDPAHPELRSPSEASRLALGAGSAPAHPTELAGLLREAIGAGVDVRVLAWRDAFQDPNNNALTSSLGTVKAVNAVVGGKRGQAIWDATSRETYQVHHQKGSFVRVAGGQVAGFLGGIDILAARWDTHRHRQPDPERPGSTWHDVHCKVEGKAAWDIYRNFMQRWNAANGLPQIVGSDAGRTSAPPPDDPAWGPTPVVDDPLVTKADGPHAAQINRTLSPHFPAYGGTVSPFDIVDPVRGDLSVKDTWHEILKVAKRFIYIEDQYFWIREHADALRAWLLADPERFLFLLLPRRFSDLPTGDQIHYALRRRTLCRLLYGVEDLPAGDPATIPGSLDERVVMFHLASRENLDPIYVHAKTAVIDDTWFTIGSANLTRRSWTFDSEINAACVDTRLRRGGHQSARELRVDLLAEHLQLARPERPLIEDARDAFRIVKEALAGKRPWMRTHLLNVDLKFTHYGPFPDGVDPSLVEAVNLVVDPDGTSFNLDISVLGAVELFRSVSSAPGDLTFGGLGRFRFTFDVNHLGVAPAEVLVRVEMRRGETLAPWVTVGTWPATAPVDGSLYTIGQTYSVRATALAASNAAPLGAIAEHAVPTTDPVTSVSLTF